MKLNDKKHFTTCNTRRKASNNNITENGSNLQKVAAVIVPIPYYI